MKKQQTLFIFFAGWLLFSCTPSPQPITIGFDECAHCRMIISEKPFGSQLVSTTGKTWFFDSVECLAAYEIAGSVEKDRVHSLWVPDFHNPDTWVEVSDAWFLHSRQLRSPMGLHLSGYASHDDALNNQSDYEGDILRWLEVKQLVQREWFD